MPTCLFCQHVNPKGGLICVNCGKRLVPLGRTSLLREARVVPGGAEEASPTILNVEVLISGEVLSFTHDEPILLGRADPDQGVLPDVDLGDAGVAGGVSRRHAQISYVDGHWYVEDLDSSMGTALNRQLLAPGARQRLKSGDELRLGGITLGVTFEDRPEE
jgi:pSer/pThr/pTyr-binding forkhead associated (FHA) protein